MYEICENTFILAGCLSQMLQKQVSKLQISYFERNCKTAAYNTNVLWDIFQIILWCICREQVEINSTTSLRHINDLNTRWINLRIHWNRTFILTWLVSYVAHNQWKLIWIKHFNRLLHHNLFKCFTVSLQRAQSSNYSYIITEIKVFLY